MTPSIILKATKYNRIGIERLWYDPSINKWFVSLDNQTYHNTFEIPPDKLDRWKKEFNLK